MNSSRRPGPPERPNPFQHPAAPDPGTSQASPSRPRTVEIAFNLWLGSVAISLVNDIVGLLTAPQLGAATDRFLAQHGQHAGMAADGAGQVSGVPEIAMLLVYLALIFAMRRGRNWARIVLTVFAGLGVLGVAVIMVLVADILVTVGFAGVVQIVLFVAIGVTMILATVFMYLTASSRYFRPVRVDAPPPWI